MKNLKKKLKSRAGESITETLVALLIAALALTMLAGSLVGAARVNHNTDLMDTDFSTTAVKANGDATVTITHEDGTTTTGSDLKGTYYFYHTDDKNNYCYYTDVEN